MSRHNRQQAKQNQAKRGSALSRPELRTTTEPRQSPDGATSFPVKVVDQETLRLIDEALTAKLPRPPLMDERILPVVDGEWRTAREIYALFDQEGPHATRHALARLAAANKIERRYDHHQTGKISRFRRAG